MPGELGLEPPDVEIDIFSVGFTTSLLLTDIVGEERSRRARAAGLGEVKRGGRGGGGEAGSTRIVVFGGGGSGPAIACRPG